MSRGYVAKAVAAASVAITLATRRARGSITQTRAPPAERRAMGGRVEDTDTGSAFEFEFVVVVCQPRAVTGAVWSPARRAVVAQVTASTVLTVPDWDAKARVVGWVGWKARRVLREVSADRTVARRMRVSTRWMWTSEPEAVARYCQGRGGGKRRRVRVRFGGWRRTETVRREM